MFVSAYGDSSNHSDASSHLPNERLQDEQAQVEAKPPQAFDPELEKNGEKFVTASSLNNEQGPEVYKTRVRDGVEALHQLVPPQADKQACVVDSSSPA